MKLGFYNSEFVLQSEPGQPFAQVGPEWKQVSQSTVKTFATKNIKAAARFRDFADSTAERVFKRHMLKAIALPPGGVLSPKGLDLYPFQRDRGVPFILSQNKTYLAHQPGLGKSAQAISAVSSKPGKTTIICPSFLRIVWAREITKWFLKDFPSIDMVGATELKHAVNWSADFLIVPDSMLIKPWVIDGLSKRPARFTFIDEGHRFKTHDATRTTALFGGRNGKIISPGLIYNSEHVSVLSGTPLLNRPIELWPILYAMAPELIDFMSFEDFGFRYGGAVRDDRGHWRFVGSSNEAELKSKIYSGFMQRITKQEVLTELPDKVREVILVDRDTRKADVRALDQTLLRELRTRDFETPKSLGDYAVVRQETGLAKVEWVADFVRMALSSDVNEQIILYAHHRRVVEKLADALSSWGPAVLYGGVNQYVRTEIEDEFQTGRCRLIIGNISAMNLGITLTKASRVVFAEYDWTPSANEQAEDRAHRIGQHDSVLCQYIVLPASIDEVVLQSVLRKEKSIQRVTG